MYLFVPPEEKAEVQSLGARWDYEAKCWYITTADASGEAAAKFSRWLPAAPGMDEAGMDEADTEPSQRSPT